MIKWKCIFKIAAENDLKKLIFNFRLKWLSLTNKKLKFKKINVNSLFAYWKFYSKKKYEHENLLRHFIIYNTILKL